MGKVELIAAIAKKMGVTKAEAEKFVNVYMECIEESLVEGKDVKLKGFGNFIIQDKEATTCRNPRKPGETIEVPAKKVIKFKISKNLKDLLNDK